MCFSKGIGLDEFRRSLATLSILWLKPNKRSGKKSVRASVRLGGELLWDFLHQRWTGKVLNLNLGTKVTQKPLEKKMWSWERKEDLFIKIELIRVPRIKCFFKSSVLWILTVIKDSQELFAYKEVFLKWLNFKIGSKVLKNETYTPEVLKLSLKTTSLYIRFHTGQ